MKCPLKRFLLDLVDRILVVNIVVMVFVLLLLQVLSTMVVLDAIISWVLPSPTSFPRSITNAISEPLCKPFRSLIPAEALGGIDLSPLMVILGLRGVSHLLQTLAVSGF